MPRTDPPTKRAARLPRLSSEHPKACDFERLRFFSEDSKLTMRNVQVAGLISAVLVALYLILDFFVYPEFFKTFFVLRISCSSLILVFTWLSTKKWARRRYAYMAISVPLTAALFISLMIFMIKDPDSSYYAGLNLCIVAAGTLFRGTVVGAILSSFLVIGMYFFATIPFLGSLTTVQEMGIYGGNWLFIISSALLVIVGTLMHSNYRFSEFVVRSKLRQNRITLEEKNQKLIETGATLHETERQLYQSAKMSFLGQLSAGVIHEIGNPLNYANQALFLLRKRVKDSDAQSDSEEIFADLQDGLDRIRSIISDLREFSHSGNETGETFPVADCIHRALRILQKSIEESEVEIQLEMDEKLQIIGINNQVTQVFTNLIHNAVQSLATQEKQRQIVIGLNRQDNEMTAIRIEDNGPGIPEEHIPNLLDPFFTTKDPGEGTGLGLSISYRIVEAHSGELKVESEVGKGTAFTVLFPGVN